MHRCYFNKHPPDCKRSGWSWDGSAKKNPIQ